MLKSDIHPPHSGLNADPVLYGVAACLAELFPPVGSHLSPSAERDRAAERDADRASDERD